MKKTVQKSNPFSNKTMYNANIWFPDKHLSGIITSHF